MLQRAYSVLTLKAVDDDQRIIEGVATTPEPDRMGDIVVPEGAKFTLPLPLLWQHNASQPIGHVIDARVGKDGITIRAKFAQISDAGPLKNRLDEAWQSVKSGLVRGLSIGFNALESSRIDGTFSFKFPAWEWLELSAVTIPANASASITTIKAIALQETAASGTSLPAVVPESARVRAVVQRALPNAHPMKKTYSEQIAEFESTRAAKVAERDGIQQKASDESRTKDAAEREKFSELSQEIESIDVELNDLRALEQTAVTKAVPVSGANADDASRSRQPVMHSVSVKDNTPPGIAMARVVISKMAAFMEGRNGNYVSAAEIAKQRYGNDPRVVNYFKTAVAGGLTTDTNWATELVEPATVDFIEYLRHKTIVGKLNLQRRPFNIRTPRQTTGGAGYWVGEGKPKLLTKFHFDAVTLPYTKVAAIAVITQELARFSSPSAEMIVRDQLAAACLERLDTDLIDPDKAVSSGVNPASLTNGVTALSSAGTAAANVVTDIQNLIEQFILNRQDPAGLVLVMPNTLALAASLMLTTNGVRQFPDLTMNGGSLLGIPVIASQYAASGASYGNMVIAIDQNAVALADDGGFSVDVSTEASLEMVDSSSQDAGSGTGASLVSMFQTNSIAIRAEREIHWVKLRSTAVSYMDDVNWGSIGSPV